MLNPIEYMELKWGTHLSNIPVPDQQRLFKEWYCYYNRDVCKERRKQIEKGYQQFFAEITGWADAKRCTKGDWLSCGWTALSFVPGGRAKGALAFGKLGKLDNAADAARYACSFRGDTRVVMADGSTKPIAKVRPGDRVLAADPKTGRRGPRTVTRTIVHDDRLVDLVVGNGRAVTTTADHPFWNATKRKWERADGLGTGDELLGLAGRAARVLGLRQGPTVAAAAYNLTVEDLHTYYVIAGETPVLVHNTGPCGPANYDAIPDESLRPYAENVVRQMDIDGTLPPGVRQGGSRTGPGIYGGAGLPPAPPRYYVETDILPTAPGGTRPSGGRLIFGGRGEVWYTNHYDDGFIQLRGPN
jgi:hypothetical protein